MPPHNALYDLQLHREVEYIPIVQWAGMGAAPVITVVGGDASITAIGLSDDADDAALAKTAATNRTGITGVQPPKTWETGKAELRNVQGVPLGHGGFAISGLLCNVDADGCRHFMRIPNCWDRDYPIYYRGVWSAASTTTSEVLPHIFSVGFFSPGDTQLSATALATPDTAMPDLNPTSVSRSILVSGNAVTNGGTIASDKRYIYWTLERGVGTTITGNLFLLGIEIEYTPRYGTRHNVAEAVAWTA